MIEIPKSLQATADAPVRTMEILIGVAASDMTLINTRLWKTTVTVLTQKQKSKALKHQHFNHPKTKQLLYTAAIVFGALCTWLYLAHS